MRIAVLGAGSWGTTLAIVLAENGHDVVLWDHDAARAKKIAAMSENARYLPDVTIPAGVAVTATFADALDDAAMVVFAVPSHTVRATARAMAGSGRAADAVVVTGTKGLEEGTHRRMSEILIEELRCAPERVVSLVGPSHAEEVSRHIATSIVAAGAGEKECRAVQEAFGRPYLRIYTNTDIVGVEIATALKNSIAIAAGILDGAGGGDNTKAALVTRGLTEIARLGAAMGARPETFSGLAGVGDLVVTCLSRHSRNRRVGEAIGRGERLDDALARLGMVAEGVRTTRAAVELGRERGVELPIIEMVHRVLFEGHDPREAIQMLMARPPRAESAGAPPPGGKEERR
ncbi:MAG TPA: NAD(P)H-dependent glycerol-3-phosphate dehydrogenase [Candidatus Krumholzibacteria bacterium]